MSSLNQALIALNAQQRQAVETTDGTVLVLAGAGSGKTRVLTLRMAYLVLHKGVSPKAILGLTFTNKAAAEMRQRLAAWVEQPVARQVTLSTFHSFCMHLLRNEIHRLGYTPHFTLINEKDLRRIVNQIARDILDVDGDLPSLAPTLEAIARAKSQGVGPEAVPPTGSEWHDTFVAQVYRKLEESLRAYNTLDFDSLLTAAVTLFECHPDILNSYQEQYRYIMIDEYQDTNPVQYKLADLLSRKYGNLCVVGDDDQSIYGWRGAEIKNILLFNSSSSIKLEQNYRSTNTILKAANAVIVNNRERREKVLWSANGLGNPIELFYAPTDIKEAEAVVYRLARLRQAQGLRWSDCAILYRSNILSRPFEEALLKYTWQDNDRLVRGIPYRVIGGVEFYERREVKDLLAYLRVIVNRCDEQALLRIVNVPRRGIGDTTLDALTAYNRKEKVSLWTVMENCSNVTLAERARANVAAFCRIVNEAKEHFERESMADAMRWLIDAIDYRRAIKEEVKSELMRSFQWDNVQELVRAMESYDNGCSRGLVLLRDFVSTMTLDSNWNGTAKNDVYVDKVNLLTFHSAKGLEFPACFLVGMEDHIIPHEKSIVETGIEEERRLIYVAITRAMHYLYISMAQKRPHMGKEQACNPSRFLLEIPRELLRFTKWDE